MVFLLSHNPTGIDDALRNLSTMNARTLVVLSLASASLVSAALAHGGRRFDIQVVDNRLVAQGYISTGVDDGGGIVRPYVNALHGHWENNPSPAITAASADLPGFDVFSGSPLLGHDITLTLMGGRQWLNPAVSDRHEGEIHLDPLGATEIFVSFGGTSHSTTAPGSFLLTDNVGPGGELDIDLSYDIAARPSNVIYVLDFVLSTNAPGVSSSDTVHVILSPDPLGVGGGLHHPSLLLESYLGTVIPTPSAGAVALLAGLFGVTRRRSR
jgi:hypothetical protein